MKTNDSAPDIRRNKKNKGDRTGWFYFYASILVPLLNLVSKRKIIDGHKLPRSGPYIITPNHFSNIDPLVIAVAVFKLKRAPRFLAKASLFKVPVFRTVLKNTGQITVERQQNGGGSQPLSQAAQIIERESVVIVYPEGTLTRDPDLWPMRGKTGAVRLARAANIPIIPVAHWGTNDLMPRYGKLRLFPRTKITIKFGDPYYLPDRSNGLDSDKNSAENRADNLDKNSAENRADTLDKNRADTLDSVKTSQGTESGKSRPLRSKNDSLDSVTIQQDTELVMSKITELLAELREEPIPEVRWNPSEHGQNETGKF